MIHTITLNPALDKTVTIPSFAPGKVNRIETVRTDPGGKGINVSKMLAALGMDSIAHAMLGGNTGKAIERALEEDGVACQSFWVEGETRTNLKVLDPIARTTTDLNEPGPTVGVGTMEEMLDGLTAQLQEGDIVVFSGSLPKGLPQDSYAEWIRACREKGAKTFLDADGEKLTAGLSALPYLVKPNEIELGAVLGREIVKPHDAANAAREIAGTGVEKVVVTMGAKGAVFCMDGKRVYGTSPSVEVASTVGAGDSVFAALAYAEAEGLDLETTIRLALACGSAKVMQSGSQAPSRELVDSLMDEVELFLL